MDWAEWKAPAAAIASATAVVLTAAVFTRRDSKNFTASARTSVQFGTTGKGEEAMTLHAVISVPVPEGMKMETKKPKPGDVGFKVTGNKKEKTRISVNFYGKGIPIVAR